MLQRHATPHGSRRPAGPRFTTPAPRRAPALLAATILVVGSFAQDARGADDDDGDEIPFDEADLFVELNDTDGDLGLHALIDGDAWRKLAIETPNEREILDVTVQGNLRRQGLTELFFESDEPSFDELSPEEFFDRFPEGLYEIEGTTIEGDELESPAELTHVLPAPADNILVSGVPVAEDCDAIPLPSVGPPVTIEWDAVTTSHPDIGRSDADIEITGYQVVVEREEPTLLVFSVDLPPDVTRVRIPRQFIALADEFKFEIVTREVSGNQTAVESCFEIEE